MKTDTTLLAVTRTTRMFAYGAMSVVLVLYLAAAGFDDRAIGAILTLTLLGDAAISLALTTSADRFGRRRTLMVGALLMAGAGVIFAATHNWALLTVTAIVGVISPTGNEIGPFLAIEQAALAETVAPARRTHVFALYQFAASLAGASGALVGGFVAHTLQQRGFAPIDAYRVVLLGYAAAGLAIGACVLGVSAAVEPPLRAAAAGRAPLLGLHRSRGVVAKLSAVFAIDSFGGGFVVQSLVAYWFHVKFGANEATIGSILFGCNLVAGLTSLLAARIAVRIGLVNTMVVTHLPSNVLLCLVPLMPTLPLAITALVLRFSISQMDMPTRQSYIVAIVEPDERSAAAGVTTIARSTGASLAPVLSGALMSWSLSAPFLAAGGLKIVYDLLLYRGFKAIQTPEERETQTSKR